MMGVIFSKMLNLFKGTQKRLFGLSLLHVLLCFVIMIMSGIVPIVGLCFVLVINSGMSLIFLCAYKHQLYKTETMFIGFYNLKHVCGGMLWAFFKTYIWLLIPFMGIFIMGIKRYEYRFVRYILISKPDVNALDAAEESKKATNGYKLTMFITDLVVIGAIISCEGILYLFSLVPYIGVLFKAAMLLSSILILLFLPMLNGAISAMFYHEISHKQLKPRAKIVVCPYCMSKADANAQYCPKCGKRVEPDDDCVPKTI